MIHKCPNCNVSLIPITRVKTGNDWKSQKMSAERLIHLNKDNYCYWKCPECAISCMSEVQRNFHYFLTYAKLKIELRREKGEHCDT